MSLILDALREDAAAVVELLSSIASLKDIVIDCKMDHNEISWLQGLPVTKVYLPYVLGPDDSTDVVSALENLGTLRRSCLYTPYMEQSEYDEDKEERDGPQHLKLRASAL